MFAFAKIDGRLQRQGVVVLSQKAALREFRILDIYVLPIVSNACYS